MSCVERSSSFGGSICIGFTYVCIERKQLRPVSFVETFTALHLFGGSTMSGSTVFQ